MGEELAKRLVEAHDSEIVAKARTLQGAFMAAMDWYGSELQCCLPAKVEAYDRVSRIATVAPMVRSLTRTGGFKQAETFSVQAFQYAANGFVVDFPIVPGDVGWVVASDRYTRNVKETHEVCDLEDISTHRYSSGFFIPDYYGILKTGDRSAASHPYTDEGNRLVISTFDGKQKISIGGSASEDGAGSSGSITIRSHGPNTGGGSGEPDNKTDITISRGSVTLSNTHLDEGSQSDPTTTTVSIVGGSVVVNSGVKVEVTTPVATVNATTSASLTTPSATVHAPSVKIDGGDGNAAVEITGTLSVSGDASVGGKLDVVGKIKETDADVTLSTHVHPTAALGPPSAPTAGT